MAGRKTEEELGQVKRPTGPLAFVVGFLLGGLAGSATLGLELLTLGWMGVGTPDKEGLLMLLAAYGVFGGLIGAVNATLGLWGGGWALGWSAMAFALLLGGKAGAAATHLGLPGAVGLVAVLGLGFTTAHTVGRVRSLGPFQMGMGATLLVFGAVAGTLNLHLLPAATDMLALAVDVGVFAAALAIGVAVGSVSSGEGGGFPQLVIANALIALLLWPVLGKVPSPPSTSEAGRPVVWITVEGLRADAADRTGRDTPTLRRVTRRGLRFEEAHSTSSWAIPALASLHTGRLPYKHGAAMNDGLLNHGGPIGARVPTAAQVLAREGYLTGAAVGDSFFDPYGLHAGWRWYRDTPARGPLPLWIDALAVARGIPPWPVKQDAAAVTDQALDFVRVQEGGKWFLWVHYTDPGRPFLSTEADREEVGKTVRPWPVDAWEASILAVDRELGRLLEGLPDDAIVLLAGTHGIQLEEERGQPAAMVPFSAVSGHTVFQELVHVPLVLDGPGVPGRTVRRPVSLVDVLPSTLHLLGIEELPKVNGQVWPELGVDPPEDPVAVVAMSMRWGREQQMARIGDDKLILRPDGSSPLYDLAADDREITARPADARNEQLERRLEAALPPMGAGPRLFERAPLMERLGRWLQATWNRGQGPGSGESGLPLDPAPEPVP